MTGNSSSTTDSVNIIALPQETVENEGLLLALSSALPWAISTVLHIGLFLILFFMVATLGRPTIESVPMGTLVSIQPPSPTKQNIKTEVEPKPEVKKFGDMELGGQSADAGLGADIYKGLNPQDTGRNGLADLTKSGKSRIVGIGGDGNGKHGIGGIPGLRTDGGNPPNTIFQRVPGNVVFVIDRSGSMLETLDFVIKAMDRFISGMSPRNSFHAIFFASNAPLENPPKKLVSATALNKQQATDFLRQVTAEGQTNPIKAIERAFQVIREKSDKSDAKQVWVINLLSDGEFSGEILAKIRALNADKRVIINTFCYLSEAGRAIMEIIAKENNGRCVVITRDQIDEEK